uniref:Uncharacterized protein n=1 Tax=Panagrolaimus davidi TaxID=227884 RepID=A0A914PS32_9BILA
MIGKGKHTITLFIDLNGIYSIKIIKTDEINEQNGLYFIPKKIQNYNSELNAIGIDFGITECCASVIRKKGPDFVVLDDTTGLRTMPSYISFDEKMPKCGQIVVDRMRYNAKYSVYDTKRIIGKDLESILIDPLWPFKVLNVGSNVVFGIETFNGKDTKFLEELSSILLKHIKIKLEAYQNTILTEAVITIPSVFSKKQKEATKLAAEIAGFETIHFLPEPVAAAFAYFTEIEIPNQSNILICDCGGGTFDICIAKVENDQLQILNFDGDSYLGGRDFDKILFTHFSAILKHKFNFDVMKSSKKYVLKKKCQEIKHKLSASEDDWLDIDDFDPNIDGVIKISREEFEEMSSNFIIQMKDVIYQTMTKSNISKNEITYVFQVGGGCRMPMIKKMLKEIFPNSSHQCTLYPDWIVAHGAALYAYQLKSGKDVRNEQDDKPKISWLNKLFK